MSGLIGPTPGGHHLRFFHGPRTTDKRTSASWPGPSSNHTEEEVRQLAAREGDCGALPDGHGLALGVP